MTIALPAFRTIGFPANLMRIRGGTFRLVPLQIGSGSRFSHYVRATGAMQMFWMADVEDLALQTRALWQEFEADVARLEGQAVLFEAYDPARELPLGAGAGFAVGNPTIPILNDEEAPIAIEGATLVTGATSCLISQDGPRHAKTALMTGLAPAAVVFKKGDLFGTGGNLYEVSGAVQSDENGVARVPFLWRLHKPVKEGDKVQLRRPTARFQLGRADSGAVQRRGGLKSRASLSMQEVPYF